MSPFHPDDGINRAITPEELQQIRELGDFDLTMLISEIHDHGWDNPGSGNAGGKQLLPQIVEAKEREAEP